MRFTQCEAWPTDSPGPAEVVGQVSRRDAACLQVDELFQPLVVGVDVTQADYAEEGLRRVNASVLGRGSVATPSFLAVLGNVAVPAVATGPVFYDHILALSDGDISPFVLRRPVEHGGQFKIINVRQVT